MHAKKGQLLLKFVNACSQLSCVCKSTKPHCWYCSRIYRACMHVKCLNSLGTLHVGCTELTLITNPYMPIPDSCLVQPNFHCVVPLSCLFQTAHHFKYLLIVSESRVLRVLRHFVRMPLPAAMPRVWSSRLTYVRSLCASYKHVLTNCLFL